MRMTTRSLSLVGLSTVSLALVIGLSLNGSMKRLVARQQAQLVPIDVRLKQVGQNVNPSPTKGPGVWVQVASQSSVAELQLPPAKEAPPSDSPKATGTTAGDPLPLSADEPASSIRPPSVKPPTIQEIPVATPREVSPPQFDEPPSSPSLPVAVSATSVNAIDDPEASALAFVEKSRREALEAHKALNAEAETLRARLRKVEAGLSRWQAVVDALPADMSKITPKQTAPVDSKLREGASKPELHSLDSPLSPPPSKKPVTPSVPKDNAPDRTIPEPPPKEATRNDPKVRPVHTLGRIHFFWKIARFACIVGTNGRVYCQVGC